MTAVVHEALSVDPVTVSRAIELVEQAARECDLTVHVEACLYVDPEIVEDPLPTMIQAVVPWGTSSKTVIHFGWRVGRLWAEAGLHHPDLFFDVTSHP